jgi:RimJ/RimL family protein N-acetyltransferase
MDKPSWYVTIAPLAREHYRELLKLIQVAEPFKGYQPYDQLCQTMDNRRGFTYWVGGEMVGCITFSDFFPGSSVMIHAAFHPKHRDAMNRRVMRHAFGFAFNTLKVRRVTTVCIKGVTEGIVKFLKGMGFKQEGKLRKAVELQEGIHDLLLFGMLREDCKWL